MEIIKNLPGIAQDLLEILVLELTAWQLGKSKIKNQEEKQVLEAEITASPLSEDTLLYHIKTE